MKKSLTDLIEKSYKDKPDVDKKSEAIGILVASRNYSKGHYVSRFIQKDEDQKETERKYILRVMLREIIIQYGDIINTENIEQIIENSNDIMFNVENFIIKCVSVPPAERDHENIEFSKQTEQKQDFLKTIFATITKFFKTI